MRTLARKTSSKRSFCVALLVICTSPIRHPVACTSSLLFVTP
jgi:hypothetical protein